MSFCESWLTRTIEDLEAYATQPDRSIRTTVMIEVFATDNHCWEVLPEAEKLALRQRLDRLRMEDAL